MFVFSFSVICMFLLTLGLIKDQGEKKNCRVLKNGLSEKEGAILIIQAAISIFSKPHSRIGMFHANLFHSQVRDVVVFN